MMSYVVVSHKFRKGQVASSTMVWAGCEAGMDCESGHWQGWHHEEFFIFRASERANM